MHPYLYPGTSFELYIWDVMSLLGWIVLVTLGLIFKPRELKSGRVALFFLALATLFTALYGAKLLYIFLHYRTLFEVHHLTFAQAMNTNGYAYLGSLAAILLTLLAFTKLRFRRISFFALSDYVMPFVMLQLVFVRIGCYLSGCCRGLPTQMPWGVCFPKENFLRHPTQLYEAAALVVLFFVLRRMYSKKPAPGVVTFATIGLYASARFFIEFFRSDSPQVFGIIRASNITMFVLAAVMFAAINLIKKGEKHGKK